MESSTQLQKRLDNAFSLAPGQRFYNRLAASLEHSDTPYRLYPCPGHATPVQCLSATLVFCCYRLSMLSRRRVVSLFGCDSHSLDLPLSAASHLLSLSLSLCWSPSPSLFVCLQPCLALALSLIGAERHLRLCWLHLRAWDFVSLSEAPSAVGRRAVWCLSLLIRPRALTLAQKVVKKCYMLNSERGRGGSYRNSSILVYVLNNTIL